MPRLSGVGQMIYRRLYALRLSRPLAIQLFSLGLLIGIALRSTAELSLWAAAAGLVALVACKRWAWMGLPAMLLIGLGFGMWRGGHVSDQYAVYRQHVDQQVVIRGQLVEDAVYNDRGQRQLLVGSVYLVEADQNLPGVIQVTTYDEARYRRGDHIEVSGVLRDRFGNRAGYIYFAEVRDFSLTDSKLEDVRRNFFAGVFTALKSPEDSLGLGFLLGTRALLPDSLNQQLSITGLTHIVAVSGYNLTVLIRICRRLFARISAYWAVSSSAIFIIGFVMMTGLVPSIFRASVVAALSLAAWYYGRRVSPWTLLLVSAGVTAAIRPSYLWYDLGWWLSFLAFIGVLIVAPLLLARLFSSKDPPLVAQIAVETSCAQLMALPLIGMVFGQLSLISIIANVLVLPLIPLAMALTALAGAAGWLLPHIVGWLAWPGQLILELITSLVALLSRVPYALAEVSYGWQTMLGLYVAIGLLYLGMRRGASDLQLSTVRDYNIVE